MKRLAKSKNYRTYKVYGEDEYLDKFEEFVKLMEVCGDWGSSKTFKTWVDGDGTFSLYFEGLDKDMKQLKDEKVEELIMDGKSIDFNFE